MIIPGGGGGETALWRAIHAESDERERAIKQLGDVLAEQLENEVQAIHKRIDEIHDRALRELTRLYSERKTT